MQALPLSAKISMTRNRIRAWYEHYDGEVYVSFSGGKDSTVLLHLVREMYPDVPAVHVNTGLEYPEIEEFVKTFDNVEIVKPKMNFKKVCQKYGYPIISKEVAECVYGARKYLNKVLTELEAENTILQTDRQTDRPYQYRFEKLCGLSGYEKYSRGGMQNKYRRARGIGNYGKPSGLPNKVNLVAADKSSYSPISWKSERLKTALTGDYGKAIDSYRIQRLMNILPMETGKATAGNIPSDRSMFSCERYQFFLDAPFEIAPHCCNIMKKSPAGEYQRRTGRMPMMAQMASESRLRTQIWLKQGCNGFDSKKPVSNPMAFWTEQDVLYYIWLNKIPIASVYGDVVKENEVEGQLDLEDLGLFDIGRPLLKTTGCTRTGCMFCLFGIQLEKEPNRLQRMKITHPKQYEWIMKPESEGGLGYKDKIDWINEHGGFHIKY